MADTVKISELPVATTISGSDTLLLVQGGITKQITESNANSAAAILAKLLTVDGSTCGLYAQYAGQVPDCGIGTTAASLANCDTVLKTGFYYGNNMGGAPPSSGYWLVLHIQFPDSNYAYQVAWRIAVSSAMYMVARSKDAGTWGAWQCINDGLNGGQPPAPKFTSVAGVPGKCDYAVYSAPDTKAPAGGTWWYIYWNGTRFYTDVVVGGTVIQAGSDKSTQVVVVRQS